jgi:flagellar hook-associated protein 2
MAGFQATGVGSGLDLATLVSQLVAAERAPQDARIMRRETFTTLEISALAGLKSGAGTLRDALSGLRSIDAFALRSATSSNKEVFTASATSELLPGSHTVEVVTLATTHRLASEPFLAGRDSVVGTGTLTIEYGTKTLTVEIDGEHDTLAQIRDAINASEGNDGVSASILNEDGGSRLVLTARATGVDNSITITQSGGDGGLAALVFDADAPGANTMTETAAVDALVRVNGYAFTSASNTVTGVVDGLTLNLHTAEVGTEYALTIANDTTAASAKIKKFVLDYNALAKTFASLQSYDATTGKAGPLLGDALVRGLEQQLRRDLTSPVTGATGAYTSLASIGITSDSKGQLKIDEARLSAALNSEFGSVASILGAEDGVAASMYKRLDAVLESDAQLALRNDSLTKQISALAKDREAVDLRMEAVEKRYRAQFTALDALLVQMQATGNFLTQQLAALNKST